ncbi:hypothetical protein [Edaphobacter dinghuensis]|uniref:Uncharacterized protein n=1 Tax=Edaphobacter dinghuensis TaxID=1560005 RepID=A0A917H112_9BACT|nr:hypothetical protein [Edaphobacter dinghuensis]GGG63766.1 hypothetical protein GCM10011585_01680 [Edaphobacter dinghuensis]
MKNRIAMWAVVGFLIAVFWAFCVLATAPYTNERMHDVWLFAGISCLIIFVRSLPVSMYQVLIANAATYALIGLVVEALRKNRTSTHTV